MLSQLVRAILPRRVMFGAMNYEVRPPTVREAVILLSVAQDAIEGDDDAAALVMGVLQGWYPPALFIASRSAPAAQVTAYALRLMHEGTPARKKSGDEVAREAKEVDWDDVLSLYMHTYGVSLTAALDEPWSGFLVMASQIGRIEARQKLNQLHVNGLPYIKNKGERNRALAQLRRLAGIENVKRTISKEEAQKNLDELAHEFSLGRGLGRAKA